MLLLTIGYWEHSSNQSSKMQQQYSNKAVFLKAMMKAVLQQITFSNTE
jgi:hypothetical protein